MMRPPRGPSNGAGFRRPKAAVCAAALLFIGVVIWGSAFLAVHNLEGGAPRLRTHRASPLPRRRHVARRSSRDAADGDETHAVALSSPHGWLDELSEDARAAQEDLRLSEVGVETLSWKPRIFRLHNLLTAEECDGLVALGRPELEASTVVDTATGEGMLSQVRTSQGMFITDNTPLTLLIRKRIAHITLLPEENQEAISVLRYQKGAFYRPHQDFFADQTNINRGGQRTATVLIYLTDVEAGGETVFPNAGGRGTCECGGKTQRGLSVRPRKGDAVLFWTMRPNGEEDNASLHGGCEVVAGEKWSATLWIRTGKFTPPSFYLQPAHTSHSALRRTMQTPPKGRHSTLADSACANHSAESLKCIEQNYNDKGKCIPLFNAYKACKKEAYEAARAARIAAHSG